MIRIFSEAEKRNSGIQTTGSGITSPRNANKENCGLLKIVLFNDRWGSELLQVTLVFIYTKCNQKEKADAVMNRFFKYASENKVEDPWDMSYIYYLKGDYKNANEWEEKAIAERSSDAYLLNITIFYDKQYFKG